MSADMTAESRVVGRFEFICQSTRTRAGRDQLELRLERTLTQLPTYLAEPSWGTAIPPPRGGVHASAGLRDKLLSAVAEVPTDGRAWFLKGMFHMYRQSQTLDYNNPTQFVLDEVDLAEAALAEAVPLLPADTRIPGFLGSATYVGGITHNDAARTQLSLDRMRDAIVLYPLFNIFNFAGTVGLYVDNTDPLFAESISYVDLGLESGCSPFNDGEVCGNVGRAPHNVEGSMMLFGDLYAKAGDSAAALTAYQLGITIDDLDTIPHLWRAELDARVTNLATRVALYQDADPLNDPLIIGEGNYENCLYCHGG